MNTEKPSLFKRIIGLINKAWRKPNELQSYHALSRFQLYAEDLTDGELSDEVLNAAALCEEALKLANRRITTANKITECEDTMRDLEAFARLTPDEVKEIKNLLETFLSVTKDRNVLRYQLTDFDNSVNVMERLEAEAETAIPKMQDSEKMLRILKQDVGYIEGEKAELEDERETLLTGLDFTNKLSIASVAGLAFAALALGYVFIVRGQPIFYPATALVLAAIAVITAIYLFRRRITFELKLNAKKQARAVGLLNKKIAVVAHHTNFLNYTYKKYRVRNSQALKKNLKEYGRYKHVTGRLDAIRDVLYETESRIEQFFRQKNIASGRLSLEQFAKNIDIEDKQRYYSETEADKRKQEAVLQELDARHRDIWELLEEMKAGAGASGEIVGAMMEMYMNEAERLMNRESVIIKEQTDEKGTGEEL